LGRKAEALRSFEKALSLYEKLVGKEHDKSQNDDALVAIHGAMGTLLSRLGRPTDAIESLRRALAIREPLALAQPNNLPYQTDWAWRLAAIGKLLDQTGRKTEALRSFKKALAIYERIVCAGLVARNPGELYNFACLLSLCVPLAEDTAQRDQYANDAMQALRTAVAAGWSRAVWTSRDPDLLPLHDRDDFRHLVSELFDRYFPADPFAR
jgi:tetratricopeptide (TPR) repeat protein